MTDFRQPWRRVEISGRRCHLQIVDPATAFELEPSLVDVLGNTLALFVAAPEQVIGTALKRAVEGAEAEDLYGEFSNAPPPASRTTEAIVTLAKLLAQCIVTAQIEPAWLQQTFKRLIYGRMRFGEEYVDNAKDWGREGLGPLAKWEVLVTQIQQSFGPLWTRSPYQLRVQGVDYKVPPPPGVSRAAQYAAEIARANLASSAREVLDEWTPVRMIEMTETQAYVAEIERRARKAAESGAKT